MWTHQLTAKEREAAGVSAGLVRFATGIEHVDDLLQDVVAAADRAALHG
jgi:O-succinylhomoserine sulfhydrylase